METLDLPKAEMDVLACLQQRGSATAGEVRAAMKLYRPLAHASVLTLLSRLQAKGLVVRKKGPVGKAFIFSPTKRSSRPALQMIQRLVKRVFAGDGVALVASLFETSPPTNEEIDRLQDLLDKVRKQRVKTK